MLRYTKNLIFEELSNISTAYKLAQQYYLAYLYQRKLKNEYHINKEYYFSFRPLLILYIKKLYKKQQDNGLISQQYQIRLDTHLNNNTQLTNVQSIFLIDQQSGGIPIKFSLEINDQQLENVAQLKESLQWLGNSQINEFIEINLQEINGNQQNQQNYQQIPLHSIIAVRLYTSNLIYRKLNSDLRTSDYQSWKKYLKCLMEGLKQMQYYKGVAYRGIRDYQNNTVYQKGKIVQWSEVSSASLNQQVAQNFSNEKGMIFNVQLISSKDIANISIYEGEQELIMYPFSTFVIDDVQVNPNQPHIVTMRELPLPRSHYVLLWVDDNPITMLKNQKDQIMKFLLYSVPPLQKQFQQSKDING